MKKLFSRIWNWLSSRGEKFWRQLIGILLGMLGLGTMILGQFLVMSKNELMMMRGFSVTFGSTSFVVGLFVGFLLTPLNEIDRRAFKNLSGAILGLISGYGIATIQQAISEFIKIEAVRNPKIISLFPVIIGWLVGGLMVAYLIRRPFTWPPDLDEKKTLKETNLIGNRND